MIAGERIGATGLRFARDGRSVLDGVDVTVEPGRPCALVGPSGSGKSTLLSLLAGLQRPDAGSVVLPRGRVGIVLQAYGLVGLLTAAENVEIALQATTPASTAPERRRRAALELDRLGLTEVADSLVEELSGGQQQRVAIARALVIDPVVVLADEPTAELDPGLAASVIDRLIAVGAAGGTVVIGTHDAGVAARCADVVRLEAGRVVAR